MQDVYANGCTVNGTVQTAQDVSIQSMSMGPDETNYPTNTGKNPMDLDEQLILTNKVVVPAFSSVIVKVRTKKTYYDRSSAKRNDTTALPVRQSQPARRIVHPDGVQRDDGRQSESFDCHAQWQR